MPPNPLLVRKIKKLLALAGNNPSEHERSVALEKAMTLLSDHNMTLSVLDAFHDAEDTSMRRAKGSFRIRWTITCWNAAAALCSTVVFASVQNELEIWICGTNANSMATISFAKWFIKTINHESKKLFESNRSRRSFCIGAAARLGRRAFELKQEREAKAKQSTEGKAELVVLDTYKQAIEKCLERYHVHKESFTHRNVDNNANYLGQKYGNEISLNHQLEHDSNAMHLPEL